MPNTSCIYDVAIAGGGPAGSACATLCAGAGLRTLVIEKSLFPRDKVCGDCLNPGCWPVFRNLGLADALLAAPHFTIHTVSFIGAGERRVTFPLHGAAPGEIAMTRRVLDDILLRRSQEAGVEVRQQTPIHQLKREPGGLWRIDAGDEAFTARTLVAADGRNSTVARLLGAAPAARRDRVGLQTHARFDASDIELHLFPEGYCGVAPVGEGMTNFCLVATAPQLDALKASVVKRFSIPGAQQWRAIAPLERAPVGPLRDGVVYIGDAARVVEPFTGEGIYYALQSAALAANHIAAGSLARYPADHASLYRRRLWINRLARWAVTHPDAGARLLRIMSAHPATLRFLVERVTASRQAPAPA